jgi:hypothetical protein
MRTSLLAVVLALVSSAFVLADEGQWPPDQISGLDWTDLKKRGMELLPDDIWDPEGRGLSRAIASLGGCTASFVSPQGLIVSNHHCLFGAVQEHSTPEHDYVRDGFYAAGQSAELPAKGVRLQVLRAFRDVTAKIRAASESAGDDRARTAAIERATKELVAACEERPASRCRVGAYYGGLRYVLFESTEIRDVRLVYAPPRSVGEYGGEEDNWMWPRHTGDFAFARAYVAPDGAPADHSAQNVPYKPERSLKLSTRGVRPGDLVMVFGYPGRTQRYLPAAAIERNVEFWYPRREEVFDEWMTVLEESTRDDPEGAIRVSGQIKSLANGLKNARGMIEGLNRNRVLEGKAAEETALREWVARKVEEEGSAISLLDELNTVYGADADTRERDFLLRYMPVGSKVLGFAQTILRWSREQEKPDIDREPGYQERDRQNRRDRLERAQKNLHAEADRRVLVYFLMRALDLPQDQRITAIDSLFEEALQPGADRRAAAEAHATRLYEETTLTDLESRLALFDTDRATLEKSEDPAIRLALALEPARDAWEEQRKTRQGALARLRPLHSQLLIDWKGGRIYPDANGTLRLSVASVKGYSPRDGVFMLPQTTLSGLLQKETGQEPFRSPTGLLETARAGDHGRWEQENLGSVPVCFLSDADTTGGNSGSPMLNGRGELVGLNFDRVFENIAGDYGWSPDYSRNVSVDVRYLLWILDRVEHADSLLRELGIEPSAP